MVRLILATSNPRKVEEFKALAKASGADIELAGAEVAGGMPPVEEDTGTFAGNAGKKAQAVWRRLSRLGSAPPVCVVADDSGLCVDALGGAPGVDSAVYAGPQHDVAANLAKLAAAMREVPDGGRQAHFVCVLAVVGPAGDEHLFEGRCRGSLRREPRGSAGFGYDPLFVPDGYESSFAELGPEVKDRISHRARAWKLLLSFLQRRGLSPAPGFDSTVS